jgi:ABC-type phosphate transport system substrate-binding protein
MAAGRRISCEVAGRRGSTIKGTSMRKLISLTMMGVLMMGLGIGISGCSDEAGTKTTQTTTAPDGSKTKETIEHKVQTSGSNPPAPATKP